jgi:hypothetical protein
VAEQDLLELQVLMLVMLAKVVMVLQLLFQDLPSHMQVEVVVQEMIVL